jgi:hypothetical protein
MGCNLRYSCIGATEDGLLLFNQNSQKAEKQYNIGLFYDVSFELARLFYAIAQVYILTYTKVTVIFAV